MFDSKLSCIKNFSLNVHYQLWQAKIYIELILILHKIIHWKVDHRWYRPNQYVVAQKFCSLLVTIVLVTYSLVFLITEILLLALHKYCKYSLWSLYFHQDIFWDVLVSSYLLKYILIRRVFSFFLTSRTSSADFFSSSCTKAEGTR